MCHHQLLAKANNHLSLVPNNLSQWCNPRSQELALEMCQLSSSSNSNLSYSRRLRQARSNLSWGLFNSKMSVVAEVVIAR